MKDLAKFVQNLENKGYSVTVCDTKEDACLYLDGQIDGESVGFGGSMTLKELGIYPMLATHNDVKWHWEEGVSAPDTMGKKVYLSSVNGVSESGEMVNIDGSGNRVASTIYGPERVYFVIGENKIAKDLEGAIWRARHIASPLNAKRLSRKTPCAKLGDKCYDCNSPERICRSLVVHWCASGGVQSEVVLVREELGY
ncbi:MAG: lactate utilization protein [Eubacteriales bacterium]